TRAVDRVVRSLQVIERERVTKRLNVPRLRLGCRVRLARVALRLGAGDVLCLRERQEIAELGGIDEVRGSKQARSPALQVFDLNGEDAIAADLGGDRPVAEQKREAACGEIGRQHLSENGESDAEIVAETRDAPIARIQVRGGARLLRQRVVAVVV